MVPGIVSGMSIRHSLLALLSREPRYGQQLKSEFEACTGELWPLNVGQVYNTLSRLERDGLIEEADGEGAVRPYQITELGRSELRSWLSAGPSGDPPPRHDLVMKVMVAVAVDYEGSVGVVQDHRRSLLESMQHFGRVKADESATTSTLMMCDAELFRLEALVRWLDSVDARVRSGALIEIPAFGVRDTPGSGSDVPAETEGVRR